MKKWCILVAAILLSLLLPTEALATDYVIDGVSYFIVRDEKMTNLESLLSAVTMTHYSRSGMMNTSLAERWNKLNIMLSQGHRTSPVSPRGSKWF